MKAHLEQVREDSEASASKRTPAKQLAHGVSRAK